MKKTKLKLDAELQGWIAATAEKIMSNPNADGWIRLCEILKEAKADKRIAASGGASKTLEIFYEIAADALTTSNASQALKPLEEILTESFKRGIKKIRQTNSHIKGGDTTHANKEARKNAIREPLNKILSDPLKARWNKDPKKITDHLVKNKVCVEVCGKVLKRTLRTYVEEIMAETAHPKPNL